MVSSSTQKLTLKPQNYSQPQQIECKIIANICKTNILITGKADSTDIINGFSSGNKIIRLRFVFTSHR
jgi:hypothetical protein